MCGLLHVKRLDGRSAVKMIIKRYNAQKERGKEGFGYLGIDDGFAVTCLKTAKEADIMKALEQESANEILFHHRFPTSTPNYAEAAHPIVVRHESLKYDYYIAHNGVIYDDEKLRDKHIALGFKYTTDITTETKCRDKVLETKTIWNDSESLAIEVALDLDKEVKGIPEVRGSIAFIASQVSKETGEVIKTFFARNYGSPLVIEAVKGQFICISSVGKGQTLKPEVLYSLDYKTNEISEQPYKIGVTSSVTTRDWTDDDEMEWQYARGAYIGTPKKDRVGFSIPALPAPGDIRPEDALIDEDTTYDDYFALKEEEDELATLLLTWTDQDGDAVAKAEWEERLIEVRASITDYDQFFKEVRDSRTS